MRMTTVSSGFTTTQALISGPDSSAAPASVGNGIESPSESPPAAAAVPTTNERRSMRESNFGM